MNLKLCLILVLFSVYFKGLNAQETNIGQMSPSFLLESLSNSGEAIDSEKLKNKVVIIDFWATWCGPCISGMKHLDSLQQEFKNDLQIIAISHEENDRIQRFMKNRPQSFIFAADSAEVLRTGFPFRVIPHTVLIDKEGRVAAITNPKNINSAVIKDLLNDKPIDLPLKKDNIAFDYSDDYFKKDSTTVESFEIQPYNPAVPSLTKKFNGGGAFGSRRISMHSTTIPGMYMAAFQLGSRRLIYEVDESQFEYSNTDNRYNLDIIVAKKDTVQFFEIFQEKLNATFETKGRIEKKEAEVYILVKSDSIEFSQKAVEKPTGLDARSGSFKGSGVSINQFAKYFESHGIVRLPVFNETGIEGLFEIDFSYEAEKKGSFQENLKRMGLELKKEKREIKMLVIY